MDFQDREGRNESLKMGFEEYLKKGKTKRTQKGQPPLAPQQDAQDPDILEEMDRALSEDNNNQTSGKQHTSNPQSRLE